MKRSFKRKWIEKFLDNWEGYIEDSDKIALKLFAEIIYFLWKRPYI